MLRRAGIGEVERKVQKSYWEEHSKDLTVESMMLDSRAADLDKEERPEVRCCHDLLALPLCFFSYRFSFPSMPSGWLAGTGILSYLWIQRKMIGPCCNGMAFLLVEKR